MKLVTYEKPEIDGIPVVNLNSMILLFVADHETEENNNTGEKSAKQYIKCIYAAYDDSDTLHLLAQYYTYGPDEESKIEKMRKSRYFDGSINSFQLITTINFFTGRIKAENTDFCCKKVEDGKYEFYAFKYSSTDENDTKFEQPVIYTINDKIKLGLEMIHSIIGSGTIISSGIVEANLWMYNETNDQYNTYKNLYKHEDVDSYTIKDISKSTKKGKNNYIGAVAVEIVTKGDGDDGRIYTMLMPYRRTEKLRRKDLTMDIGLMETAYEGAYVIGQYGASPMSQDESDIYRIIGYSDKQNKYVILDFSTELRDKFSDDIENI